MGDTGAISAESRGTLTLGTKDVKKKFPFNNGKGPIKGCTDLSLRGRCIVLIPYNTTLQIFFNLCIKLEYFQLRGEMSHLSGNKAIN